MSKIELKKSPVFFDEGPHTYTLNGKELGGVTDIVKWLFPKTYDNIPDSVMDAARERGSFVHKKCEQYDTCGFGDDIDEVKDYVRLKAENGLTTIANEYLVDDGKNIASSIDVVFNKDAKGCYPLADIKTTSKVHRLNVSLQLSIYAYMFERCNKGKKAGALYVLWLPKQQYGDAALIEVERISSAACKEIIKAYLKGEDAAPYREKYFGQVESVNELGMVEEALPAALKDAEDEIVKIEKQLKQISTRRDELKAGLYKLMVENNVKKWESQHLRITRKLDSERETLDAKKVEKEYPDVYANCLRTSKVKGGITITVL